MARSQSGEEETDETLLEQTSDQPSIKQPSEGQTLTHMQLQYITHSCSSLIKCFRFCLRRECHLSVEIHNLKHLLFSLHCTPSFINHY